MLSGKELQANELLGKIIDLMRYEGWKVDSPYDIENFIKDYASHRQCFQTGRFKELEES